MTGSTVSGQAVARLHEVTGGNPYFLGEVVRLLGAGDTLDSLGEPARDPLLRIPEEIRVLIRRPRGGASSRAVAALRRAAVIGREEWRRTRRDGAALQDYADRELARLELAASS